MKINMNQSLEDAVKSGMEVMEHIIGHAYERGECDGMEAYANALKTLLRVGSTVHSFADETVALLSMDAAEVVRLAGQSKE